MLVVQLDRSKEARLPQLHAPGPGNKESEHGFFPLAHMETHIQHVFMDTHSQLHRSIQTEAQGAHAVTNSTTSLWPCTMTLCSSPGCLSSWSGWRSITRKYIHVYYADSSSDWAQAPQRSSIWSLNPGYLCCCCLDTWDAEAVAPLWVLL